MKRSEINTIISLTVFITVIIFGIIFICFLLFGESNKEIVKDDIVEPKIVFANETESNNNDNISDGFIILPETSYICQKDNGLRMYVDLVMDESHRLYAYGDAYHVDNHMKDMMFKEFFYPDNDNSVETYYNLDKSIIIHLSSDHTTATIEDYRQEITLSFEGLFKRVQNPDNFNTEEPIAEMEINDEAINSISENNINEDSEFYIDTGSADPDSVIINSSEDFYEFVSDTNNERKKISISGIFKEVYPNYSGSKFVSLDGSITFYVFGVGSNPDYTSDMKATMNLIYRGQNPRYNGLDFSSIGARSEYCFNLDSMTKIE